MLYLGFDEGDRAGTSCCSTVKFRADRYAVRYFPTALSLPEIEGMEIRERWRVKRGVFWMNPDWRRNGIWYEVDRLERERLRTR